MQRFKDATLTSSLFIAAFSNSNMMGHLHGTTMLKFAHLAQTVSDILAKLWRDNTGTNGWMDGWIDNL